MGRLQQTEVMGGPACMLDRPLERPAYVFAMEPQSCSEPAEDAFTTHYSKTDISAYGGAAGWGTEMGLKTEIVRLLKRRTLGRAVRGMGAMRRVLATFALIAAASTAAAHELSVFAFVEDGEVVVESKFSNGSIPVEGEVRVMDASQTLLATVPLDSNGTVRFPLDLETSADGLVIEVGTGEGHEDYWILTPEDIAKESGR